MEYFCLKLGQDLENRAAHLPRDIRTIQCVNILCKAVNSHLSNQSDHDTRIWYHKTATIKDCPQVPFFFSRSHGYRAIFLFAFPHLGACSQATTVIDRMMAYQWLISLGIIFQQTGNKIPSVTLCSISVVIFSRNLHQI